jgi:hypothetical protein
MSNSVGGRKAVRIILMIILTINATVMMVVKDIYSLFEEVNFGFVWSSASYKKYFHYLSTT